MDPNHTWLLTTHELTIAEQRYLIGLAVTALERGGAACPWRPSRMQAAVPPNSSTFLSPSCRARQPQPFLHRPYLRPTASTSTPQTRGKSSYPNGQPATPLRTG